MSHAFVGGEPRRLELSALWQATSRTCSIPTATAQPLPRVPSAQPLGVRRLPEPRSSRGQGGVRRSAGWAERAHPFWGGPAGRAGGDCPHREALRCSGRDSVSSLPLKC